MSNGEEAGTAVTATAAHDDSLRLSEPRELRLDEHVRPIIATREYESAAAAAYVCHKPASDSFPSFAIASRQLIVIIERN